MTYYLRWSRRTLIFIIIVLAALSPYEESLGSAAKLVYLHGALIWDAFLLIGLTAACGIAAFFSDRFRPWTGALLKAALIFLTVNLFLVPIVTKLTWGFFFAWQEPRVAMTFFLVAFAWGVYILQDAIGSEAVRQGLMVLPGVVLAVLLLTMGRVLHPVDPIGTSGSLSIKLFSLAMLLAGLLLGVLWASDFRHARD